MIRVWVVTLFLLAATVPAMASRHYAILSPEAVVIPAQGTVTVYHDGQKSVIQKPCSIEEGDQVYVSAASQAVLRFPDGHEESVDGESDVEVSPLFSTKPPIQWGSIKRFFSSLYNRTRVACGFIFVGSALSAR